MFGVELHPLKGHVQVLTCTSSCECHLMLREHFCRYHQVKNEILLELGGPLIQHNWYACRKRRRDTETHAKTECVSDWSLHLELCSCKPRITENDDNHQKRGERHKTDFPPG